MKGIIFAEFLELVEDTFGLEICQQILDENQNDGVYTSVGTYDHHDLIKLIVSLSKLTGISIEDLQEVYGKSVFITLFNSMPGLEGKSDSTFSFIKSVEEYIHIEVKKLYQNANPPTFNFISATESQLVMDYVSARCMSHVCLGLIRGCAEHFGENIEITMEPITEDQSEVRFTITYV
ncbi:MULTISPECIES: heme NO-binding domain-containing protein [unclassified Shewanella]|uniref:heme NO-binding domain-containing protein n=1 Tax=unclassified Shewanella TaxID=196818 RepID=UPI000C7AA70C|nr:MULTISPECIES: heme NO-binding domain-containing protein [unclassified Shewanella]PKG58985.1 guanylate cyclase [Shewanella sp. GutDb-MelDb]PKG73189.1 guanylate cyclase [Shewanella sp. GutCb]